MIKTLSWKRRRRKRFSPLQLLRSIVALDGFGDDGAGGVTSGEVLTLGLYDPCHVAARQACEDANE